MAFRRLGLPLRGADARTRDGVAPNTFCDLARFHEAFSSTIPAASLCHENWAPCQERRAPLLQKPGVVKARCILGLGGASVDSRIRNFE